MENLFSPISLNPDLFCVKPAICRPYRLRIIPDLVSIQVKSADIQADCHCIGALDCNVCLAFVSQ